MTDALAAEVQRLVAQGRAEGVAEGREQAAKAIEADGGFESRYEQAYAARVARGTGER